MKVVDYPLRRREVDKTEEVCVEHGAQVDLSDLDRAVLRHRLVTDPRRVPAEIYQQTDKVPGSLLAEPGEPRPRLAHHLTDKLPAVSAAAPEEERLVDELFYQSRQLPVGRLLRARLKVESQRALVHRVVGAGILTVVDSRTGHIYRPAVYLELSFVCDKSAFAAGYYVQFIVRVRVPDRVPCPRLVTAGVVERRCVVPELHRQV